MGRQECLVPPPTPPTMRVRSGRFIAVLLMAGYALAAGNASPGRVQWHAEVCSAPPCGCDVRSFSSCEPTMTSADSCLITSRVAAWRAVQTGKSDCVFARFGSGQSPQPSAWFVSGTARPGRSSLTSSTPHAKQVSPGKNANCRCTSAAFTAGCVPVGFAAMCQLASHPSALTMRFLSVASHLLHSGFLQTTPRGAALAVGSWLSCSR